jgi:transposase
MLDEPTRTAILRLQREGHGTREIARVVGVSRGAVKKVIRDGRAEVARIERAEKAEPHRAQILELYASCKGNLVRVREELAALGVDLAYPTLTAFCRRHRIGRSPDLPAGTYAFAPGEEMQHDTSPHQAVIGGRRRPIVTASLALCFSRMLFAQMYPRFSRFECKVFLTDALTYFGGACQRGMTDNTHVIVLSGTGRDMVPVPEMAAFAERYGFEWRAHALGNANRSARVERPFDYIENNFLVGRQFADWQDLNQQAIAWCDKVNAKHRRHLHASARELFATEQAHLRPLPAWVPEVYALHHRIVDNEGYVNVQRNRYSAPWQLMGRNVEVRETKERIDIFDGPRRVASHVKVLEPRDERVIDPAHRPPRGDGVFARRVCAEEKRITERMPEISVYVALLKRRGRGTIRDLRWLLRLLDDYPADAVRAAIEIATQYGMIDLERLERMVLRRIVRDFFLAPRGKDAEPSEDDDDG